MQKNTQKGFTLIELLVVIAIIGILATIVLSSLQSAREKGNDAKISSQLSSMRAQAQLYSTSASVTGQAVPGSAVTAGNGTNPIAAAAGNLFSDATPGSSSLTGLIAGLPAGTPVYYYANTVLPSTGGVWAFAAGTSTGAFCVHYNGIAKSWAGTKPITPSDFTTAFTSLASGSCN